MTVPGVGKGVTGQERPELSPAAQRWVDGQLAQAPPLRSEQRERIQALLCRRPAL